MQIISDRSFLKEDFSLVTLLIGEYDNCTFINCSFNEAMLNGIVFTQCRFEGCNLSNAKT